MRSCSAERHRYLADDRVDGEDPLASFSPTAHLHLRHTGWFSNVADIMVGSFYDPDLDEGCAFEAHLVPRRPRRAATRPFILFPRHMPVPEGPILGAAAVHQLLAELARAGGRTGVRKDRGERTPRDRQQGVRPSSSRQIPRICFFCFELLFGDDALRPDWRAA